MAATPPVDLATGALIDEVWVDAVRASIVELQGLLVTPWTAVVFNGNWANFASGYNACQYRKEGDRVWLRGLVLAGSSPPALIATLPAGFRPVANALMSVGDTTAGHVSRFDINTLGTLTVTAPAAGIAYSLENISFSTVA